MFGNKQTHTRVSYECNVECASTNGTLVALSSGGNIVVLDAQTKVDLHTLKVPSKRVTCMAFSSDNKTLAVASPNGEGGEITLFDLSKDTPRVMDISMKGHCVAFSPDNKTLAVASGDGPITVWDMSGDTPKERGTLTGHLSRVSCLSFSPDNETLASGSYDRAIMLWHVSRDTLGVKDFLEGHEGLVSCIAWCQQGKMLASGAYDHTIMLWDAATGKEVCTLEGHTRWLSSVAFSPDNKTLASGAYDNTVKLWDVSGDMPEESAKCTLKSYEGEVLTVAFSTDSKTLVTASESVVIWEVPQASVEVGIKRARVESD